MTILIMIGIGGIAGLLGGYLGIGGGALFVPLFNEYLRYKGIDLDRATVVAASTSLAVTAVAAGSAAIERWRKGEVVVAAIPPVFSGAIIGSLLGAWTAASIPGRTVRLIFTAFLIMTAMHLITEKQPLGNEGNRIKLKPAILVGVGVYAGFFSSLLGLGGGIILVPLFLLIFQFPWEKASGTSSALASLTSLIGVAGYILMSSNRMGTSGLAWSVVDWKNAAPVAFSAVIASWFGVRMSRRFGERVFRIPFILLLLIIAARMFTSSF